MQDNNFNPTEKIASKCKVICEINPEILRFIFYTFEDKVQPLVKTLVKFSELINNNTSLRESISYLYHLLNADLEEIPYYIRGSLMDCAIFRENILPIVRQQALDVLNAQLNEDFNNLAIQQQGNAQQNDMQQEEMVTNTTQNYCE